MGDIEEKIKKLPKWIQDHIAVRLIAKENMR